MILSPFIIGETDQNADLETDLQAQSDSYSRKLLERNRERRKVVSAALEDLTECDEEEEQNPSLNLSTSPVSPLSSFKNKFSFKGRSKVRRKRAFTSLSCNINKYILHNVFRLFFYYQSREFEFIFFIFFIFFTLEINMYMLGKKCCCKKK